MDYFVWKTYFANIISQSKLSFLLWCKMVIYIAWPLELLVSNRIKWYTDVYTSGSYVVSTSYPVTYKLQNAYNNKKQWDIDNNKSPTSIIINNNNYNSTSPAIGCWTYVKFYSAKIALSCPIYLFTVISTCYFSLAHWTSANFVFEKHHTVLT